MIIHIFTFQVEPNATGGERNANPFSRRKRNSNMMESMGGSQYAGSNHPMNPHQSLVSPIQQQQTMGSIGMGPCPVGVTPQMRPCDSQSQQSQQVCMSSVKPTPWCNMPANNNNKGNTFQQFTMSPAGSFEPPRKQPRLSATGMGLPSLVSYNSFI